MDADSFVRALTGGTGPVHGSVAAPLGRTFAGSSRRDVLRSAAARASATASCDRPCPPRRRSRAPECLRARSWRSRPA
ncbi:hypothetical protein NKG05_20920 [Oerskovia sp. M15]